MPRALRVLVPVLLLVVPLTGCASNVWSTTFQPTSPAQPSLVKETPVRVRDVPWSRLDTTLREITQSLAESDAPLEEWSPSEQEALKQRLLTGLQVTRPSSEVSVIGRSEFRTTRFARPNEEQMRETARLHGANEVVWSSTYVGKAETVRTETAYSYGTGFGYGPYDRYDPRFQQRIAYVPVVVNEDEYAFIAYFLRIGPQ